MRPLILGFLLLLVACSSPSPSASERGPSATPVPAEENGTPAAVDLPPAGEAWFGDTYDQTTFEIANRKTEVGLQEAFVMVASLPQGLDRSELLFQVTQPGDVLLGRAPLAVAFAWGADEGSGGVWGFPLGPAQIPGEWLFEVTDVDGNALAGGTILVVE